MVTRKRKTIKHKANDKLVQDNKGNIEERKELSVEEQKFVLDVPVGGKIRRYEFASEKEKEVWKKMTRKRKLYTPYFLLGISINFFLYFAGLDLSQNFFLGPVVGVGIPLITMIVLAEIHYRYSYTEKND